MCAMEHQKPFDLGCYMFKHFNLVSREVNNNNNLFNEMQTIIKVFIVVFFLSNLIFYVIKIYLL